MINGVKTWCTFGARADVLMLLARTDPDRSKTHRGLSLFVVPKPRGEGHGFEFTDDRGGKMEGRAIDTIGYRGMHSYEIAFDNWFVASDNLVGGEDGLGKGFYLQMAGFENGRLQTAARAVGVMQAAYEDGAQYAADRVVFGKPIARLPADEGEARAAWRSPSRPPASSPYAVARLMAKGEGALEAAMVKAYVCKAAEWVTREAMQIHGGYGYAEEYAVQPLLRRRARAVDLRGRRRDAVPQGHRPPSRRTGLTWMPQAWRRCCAPPVATSTTRDRVPAASSARRTSCSAANREF